MAVVKKLSYWLKFQVRLLKDSIQHQMIVGVYPQKCPTYFTKPSLAKNLAGDHCFFIYWIPLAASA